MPGRGPGRDLAASGSERTANGRKGDGPPLAGGAEPPRAGVASGGLVRVEPPPGRPRLPAGQTLAPEWPVLHYGDVPEGPSPWSVRLFGAVAHERAVALDDLPPLGAVEIAADVHCVSGWSLLGSRWTGVPFGRVEALAAPRPEARFLMAHAAGGWSTNLPLADCRRPGVALVWARDGGPLPPAHGGPLRLFVPHLYLWKSCKWLVALEWMTEDRPGFWERNTKYHNLDPWHQRGDGA